MRILMLSRWLPYPPDNGAKMRIFNVLRTLAERHEVSLLAFTDETDEDEATRRLALGTLGGICRSVRLIPYRRFRPTRARALGGFLSPQPRFLVDTFSREMAGAVRAAVAGRPPGLVVATELDMAPYALGAGVPALLEELELSLHHDAATARSPMIGRARSALTWLKLRAYLRRVLPRFAACTVVSERERELLRRVAPDYDRVAVIPNAVDLERYRGAFGAPAPDTLVHAGALSYHANLDAVRSFLSDIFPSVRAATPAAHLRVTGAAPAGLLATLPPSPGVEYTGYLDDIRPAIARSWLSIVPPRIGSGTRLKILESLALGTPVVATPKGAEGLALIDGEEILIGRTPAAFAGAVTAVLRSPELRARLARAGRRRVEASYTWRRVGQQLSQLVESIPSGAAGPFVRDPEGESA